MKFKKGDWILYAYGFSKHKFCIIDVKENYYKIWNPSWLVSSALWQHYSQVDNTAKLLYNGKRRWWWNFMIGVRDFISPYERKLL